MISLNYIPRYLCVTLVFVLIAVSTNPGGEETSQFAEEGLPFLKKYCFSCHAGDAPAAELALNVFSDDLSLIENRDVWDRVLDMVTTGYMPPSESEHQPTIEASDAFVAHIEAIFEHADRTAKPDPGRITVRRLNRVEYKNTVRDMLGVDFDPTENFPADDVGHGFDNIGDVLTMSPLLMERYLEAAEAIATRVILVDPPPPSKRYQRGSRLNPRHDDVPDERFRLLAPTATEAWKSGPFTTGATFFKMFPDEEIIYKATLYAETDNEMPVEVALFIQGEGLEEVSSPEELARLVGVDPAADNGIKILKTFEITSRDPKKNQTVEYLVTGIPNIENAGIAMVKPTDGEASVKLQIRTLWAEGPLDTRPDTQLEILACTPDIPQIEQTREVLTRLLRRGYRRPPTETEVEELVQFAASVQDDDTKWEAAIQQAIKVILCSPKFLFRLELDDRPQTPDPYAIDEFQLASRLSYFVWRSMPDDELFELASQNQLTVNLEAQVKRLLADPKAAEFARDFGTQWLQIQRLATVTPDPERFPHFRRRGLAAMLKETELFLESIFREDRSVLDLLDADYTFLNQELANHYGIADTNGNWKYQEKTVPGGEAIKGSAFRRVALQGTSRGGILTHASVLTVTSNPTRTSPVKRGRWVLEQILGSPPPPPPPDVPELEEEQAATSGTSLRELLEQHREDPACANCHAKMDPIGFALENYNAIGAFRKKDGGLKIDTAAELPDGTTFDGIADLKQILKDRKQEFVRCLTEKMLIYALGRGLEYYDRPTVDRIVAQLEAEGYKSSVLVTEIVKSDPFRLRRGFSN
ncbi:DUF1592 domain-containing protein [Candidatus Poribacteria bacterium]|nr:DUF1592 domain-containing protein [Candidatus Poribacteria bacterium]MYG07058.1 DUF1592 domain-containing protein [Candidatus Poribacteria bacterium]MYK23006.1 DUF1592 domain-containing protein [Candidatus Poribacteria bacterium]